MIDCNKLWADIKEEFFDWVRYEQARASIRPYGCTCDNFSTFRIVKEKFRALEADFNLQSIERIEQFVRKFYCLVEKEGRDRSFSTILTKDIPRKFETIAKEKIRGAKKDRELEIRFYLLCLPFSTANAIQEPKCDDELTDELENLTSIFENDMEVDARVSEWLQ